MISSFKWKNLFGNWSVLHTDFTNKQIELIFILIVEM